MIKKLKSPFNFSIEENGNVQVFNTTLVGPERAVLSPYEESILAAKLVNESLEPGQAPVLILKANWESLLTFKAFLEAGIKFSVLTLTFKSNYEDIEFKWLKSLCAEHDISLSEACFDYLNTTHLNELDHIASELKCNYMEALLNIWTVCKTDDYPILPGNFIFPITETIHLQAKWNLPAAVQKKYFDFFEEFDGLPFFLGTTSELAYSFLRTKIASECYSLSEKHNDSIYFSYEIKKILYTDSGFSFTEPPPVITLHKYIVATRNLQSVEVSRYLALNNLKFRDQFRFSGYVQKIESFLYPQLVDVLRLKTKSLILPSSGGGIVMPKDTPDSKIESVVLFPKLMTMQRYEGDLPQLIQVIEKLDYYTNVNNSISNLDLQFHPELQQLVDFFKCSALEYFKKSGLFVEDIEISLCWANKSIQGQSHFKHQHPNSQIGGVLYLSTAGGGDTVFYDETYRPIRPLAETETVWNTDTFRVKPQAGLLLVFSSNVAHSTMPHRSKEPRYSISFNAIIKGQVGAIENAAWMNL